MTLKWCDACGLLTRFECGYCVVPYCEQDWKSHNCPGNPGPGLELEPVVVDEDADLEVL